LQATLLALLLGGATPAGAAEPPVSQDVYERGEQVLRGFCLSCHGVPGGKPSDPLGPRLRPELWGDPEKAYANVGELHRINRRMDQPFQGSDADRRALSLWLSRRARENVVPPWKAAAPWAATAVVVLAAGLLLVRARRRGEAPRSR
jgi:mono/diheme cytochrome c family protein